MFFVWWILKHFAWDHAPPCVMPECFLFAGIALAPFGGVGVLFLFFYGEFDPGSG